MMPPSLSIVTICFENPEDLERTCRSIAPVVSSDIEHLIVDGSRDQRCRKIAERYPIAKYLGGRDRGKYDAMNKGVEVAAGSAVLFINSGDEIAKSSDLVSLVNRHSDRLSKEMFFGDCVKRIGKKLFYHPAPNITEAGLRVGVLPSHQSIIIPRQYQSQNPYDWKMTFAADTKFLKKAFSELSCKRVNFPIGVFEYGGVSSASGSLASMRRQYNELALVHELTTLEKCSTAFLLIRRKIVNTILGPEALLNGQARRLARTCRPYVPS